MRLKVRVRLRHGDRVRVRTDDGDDEALVGLEVFRTRSSLPPDQRAWCRPHPCRMVRMLSASRVACDRAGCRVGLSPQRPPHRATLVRRWSSTPRWPHWRSIGPTSTCPLGERNEELRTLAVDYLKVQFPARQTSLAVQVRNRGRATARHGHVRLRPKWPTPSPCARARCNGVYEKGARHSRRSRTKPDGIWPSDIWPPPRSAPHSGGGSHGPARLRLSNELGPEAGAGAGSRDEPPRALRSQRLVQHGGPIGVGHEEYCVRVPTPFSFCRQAV